MSHALDIYSLILLSVALAMDAFSVSIVAGFGLGKVRLSDSIKVSTSFGAAHVIMPIVGWYLGSTVITLIQRWDHWLAFILLAFVGGRMLREGLNTETGEVNACDLLGLGSLLMFTVAVSIDALAVGLSFSLEQISIWFPSLIIGAGTLFFTFLGLNIGNRTGQLFGKRAQIIGGIVLILIGLRIVIEHML
jgi:putative Mn2+ efflux pump MntP